MIILQVRLVPFKKAVVMQILEQSTRDEKYNSAHVKCDRLSDFSDKVTWLRGSIASDDCIVVVNRTDDPSAEIKRIVNHLSEWCEGVASDMGNQQESKCGDKVMVRDNEGDVHTWEV